MKFVVVMVDSSHPLDMSTKDYCLPSPPSPPSPLSVSPSSPPSVSPPSQPCVSPPPLTKREQKTPSSPREFFAKLYGPDNTNESTNEAPIFPQDIIAPDSFSSLHSPPRTPSFQLPFLRTFPPQQAEFVNMDHLPFPGGLAAFCE